MNHPWLRRKARQDVVLEIPHQGLPFRVDVERVQTRISMNFPNHPTQTRTSPHSKQYTLVTMCVKSPRSFFFKDVCPRFFFFRLPVHDSVFPQALRHTVFMTMRWNSPWRMKLDLPMYPLRWGSLLWWVRGWQGWVVNWPYLILSLN